MTKEQMRVKVAELSGRAEVFRVLKRGLYFRPNAAGYTGRESEAGEYTKEEAERWAACSSGEVKMQPATLPNYPDDLNCCAEFERAMAFDQQHAYSVILAMYAWPPCATWTDWRNSWALITATAEQRCLAFIATMEDK